MKDADPVEKEPEGQSPLNWARPEAEQYLPAGQSMHVDEVAPPEENVPGEQRPLTAVRPALLQNAPASHGKHAL